MRMALIATRDGWITVEPDGAATLFSPEIGITDGHLDPEGTFVEEVTGDRYGMDGEPI